MCNLFKHILSWAKTPPTESRPDPKTVFPYSGLTFTQHFMAFENWGRRSNVADIINPLWEKILEQEPRLSNLPKSTSEAMYALATQNSGLESPRDWCEGIIAFNDLDFIYKVHCSGHGREADCFITLTCPNYKIEITCRKWDVIGRRFEDKDDDRSFTLTITKLINSTESVFTFGWYATVYKGSAMFEREKKPSRKRSWWQTKHDPHNWHCPKGEDAVEMDTYWPLAKVLQDEFLTALGLRCMYKD